MGKALRNLLIASVFILVLGGTCSVRDRQQINQKQELIPQNYEQKEYNPSSEPVYIGERAMID